MADSPIVGVTAETVAEWKAKYGELFMVTMGDEKFVYRPIKRFEYKTMMNTPDSNRAYNEEKICSMCVIHPAMDALKLPTVKAGTVSTLVELIMAASNFGVTEEPVRL